MSPRGGWRGGGRPTIPDEQKRQTLTCRVSPDTKQWLEEQKQQTSMGIGELVDLAVEVLQKHPDELPPDIETEAEE